MSNDVIVAIITALLTSTIGPIAVHYAKEIAEKRKKKENPLTESLKVNQMINEKLEEIKQDFDVDRIWLLQFHNGGHFYPTGKSIQKFSMVYELLKPSVVPCQNQFQNIPVSLFSTSINHLLEGNTIQIQDISVDEARFEGITSVVFGAGVQSTYMFPIFNIKGEFVGIVGVDYVIEIKTLSDEDIKSLSLEISTIGGVINNYLQA
jgi:hypothetical protein